MSRNAKRLPSIPLLLLLAPFLLALPPAPATAQAPERSPGGGAPPQAEQEPTPAGFARHAIALTWEMGAVVSQDLTGDGRAELVVVEVDRSRRERPAGVAVHVQTGSGFVRRGPPLLPLPDGTALVGVARLSGGPVLAILAPGRVVLWPWRDGRFRPAAGRSVAVESMFPVGRGGPVDGIDWIADLNGDGRDELLVPRFGGIAVLAESGGRLAGHVRLEAFLERRLLDYFRRDMVAFDLPAVRVADVDGRGWRDVITYNDGLVEVFLLGPRPAGDPRAPDRRFDLQPPRPLDPGEPWDPPLRLVEAKDLSGDGHLDFVFTKNDAADSAWRTTTRTLVHFGRSDGDRVFALDETPQRVFSAEGFTVPILLDVNGDTRTDLVLVNAEVTFWNAIRALITRTVSADAAFYVMDEAGGFPQQPASVSSYSVQFSLSRFGHQPIATFGDFNGDGLPDLLLSQDADRLGLHWGRAGEVVWDDDPDRSWQGAVPINGKRVQVADLDGDGRDDLLLTFNRDDIRQMPEVHGTFTVLLSRFGPAAAKERDATPALPPGDRAAAAGNARFP